MATVLITGSSTGIGLAPAVALARARHDVYATMRNPDRSPELRTIAHQESLPLTILRLDVDSDASVTQAVRQVLAERRHIDALVNNAGTSPFGAVEDLPLDVFRRTMETNYFGALRCMQAVLPAMRARRSECIINVTSVAGRIALGAHGSYTATKYALEALSEALAQEVKPHRRELKVPFRCHIQSRGVLFDQERSRDTALEPGAYLRFLMSPPPRATAQKTL